MNIINATLNNIDEIAYLFDLYRQFYNKKSNIIEAKKFIQDRLINQESIIFLAINNNNNIVGFVQLYPIFSSVSMKKLWLLNDLFVLQEYRNKKIATMLLEKSKELAILSLSKGLMLQTDKDNIVAQKLYEKFGFELDKEYLYNLFLH